jgi:uncharacterized membrane protein YhaH (DUF805 family)
MDWGHFLFGFSGRINRAKYWLWILLYVITALIVGIVIYATANSPLIAGIVQFVFGVIVFISSLAVISKRLHDRDRSAWWLLVFMLLPTILIGVGAVLMIFGAVGSNGANMGAMGWAGGLLMVVAAAILLWSFVEFACLRGTVGPNQYGPDPLEGRM